jgi:hypothetical protein
MEFIHIATSIENQLFKNRTNKIAAVDGYAATELYVIPLKPSFFKMELIMKLSIILFLFISISVVSNAGDTFENNIFTIKSVESSSESGQILQMFLPPSDGFAPNVNVLSQTYNGSLKEYHELTNAQLNQFKMKIIKSAISNDSLLIEYSGNMQDKLMHFYAIAYKKDKQIYLATATTLESQWPTVSKKLILIVESFKMKEKA